MFLKPRSWLPQRVIDLWDAVRFELATAWCLTWQRTYAGTDLEYLQVGSGDKLLPGFLNTDHFLSRKADFHCDIRHPLPFASKRWAGIYAHHIVEHIWYGEALRFFGECLRVLKPDGTLRIVVPDSEKFIRAYAGPNPLAALRALLPEQHHAWVNPQAPMGYIGYAVYSGVMNQHRSAWDFEIMRMALIAAGFAQVQRVECGQSRDPKLCNHDTPHWAAQSLYVEAVA
ncbi:MAG: class I SAM-dependent methyltransferase [Pseudolabrys sp.]